MGLLNWIGNGLLGLGAQLNVMESYRTVLEMRIHRS